jgi:hypothetical protein
MQLERTKHVDGEDLTAKCFLIVENPLDQSTWKLPFRFSDENQTRNHLRNDLARFNETSAPQELKDAAWVKLVALANQSQIELTRPMRRKLTAGQLRDLGPLPERTERPRRPGIRDLNLDPDPDPDRVDEIRERLTVR